MAVPVVQVRHVRMIVHQGHVLVRMCVRLLGRPLVRVPVVLVMDVEVVVLHRLVGVPVRVPLEEEECDPGRHGSHGDEIDAAERVAKKRYRRQRAHEGRRGEEGGLAGSPEVAQGVHVEDDAQAIAEQAHD